MLVYFIWLCNLSFILRLCKGNSIIKVVDFWDLSRTNYTGLEGHENDNQQCAIARALTSI